MQHLGNHLVIKGIEPPDRKYWGRILDRHRINVRHASNELNWQLENNRSEGLQLKQQLVQLFEAEDLRTYRLCFAIKTHLKSGLFGSVIIRKIIEKPEPLVYEILHTRDFNPNTKEFIVYKTDVAPINLAAELIVLCNFYYSINHEEEFLPIAEITTNEAPQNQETCFVYQCKNCLTVYNEVWGDALNDIAPGTDFNSLTNYCCPTCEAPKQDFIRLEKPVSV